MTINRRIGIFETNSSSSHSITLCISPIKNLDQIPIEENDFGEPTCYVYPGEFGWGVSQHTDAPTKASYCVTHLMARSVDVADDEKHKDTPNARMLINVLQRGTGVENIEFKPSNDDYHRWGYIDHQSEDVPVDIFCDEDTLFNFIFNPYSELIIDHDNHEY